MNDRRWFSLITKIQKDLLKLITKSYNEYNE